MDYLILALATWRISSLLVEESGPWQIFARLRARVGVRYDENLQRTADSMIGELFSCIWCMSVWIGLLIAFCYQTWPHQAVWGLMPLALSASAIVFGRWVTCHTT